MGNQVAQEKSATDASTPLTSKIIKANAPQNRGSNISSKESLSKGKRVANQKRQKMVIASQDVEINKDINMEQEVLEVIKKNNHEDEDHALIETCLLNHFFMRSLEKQARNEIIHEITLFKVKENIILFKQGSIGHFFYIIKEGEIDLLIDDKKIKTLKPGDSFGELALMHGAPRSGTVISVTSCKLWCMERRNFRKIIEHINDKNYCENSQFIDGINLFANIDKDLKNILAKNLIKVYYNEKQNIVKEGDLASCLYIIKEGEVDCVSNGRHVRTLKKGDYFGEKSVLLECKRTMDVNAKTDCICYVISVDALKNMVGEKYISVLLFNFLEMAFKMSKSFNKINPKLFQSFFDIFQLKNYTKGEIVVPSGHYIGSAFFIIIEGSLTKNKKDTEFKRGEILFEDELITFNSKEAKRQKTKLAYDLLADPDCLVMICETAKLMEHLGNSFKEIFNQSSALSSLTTIPLFKHVSQAKLSYLTKVIKIKSFEHNTFIIKQGEQGETFYIVKTGKVNIMKNNKYIRTINENESFGFKALFNKEIRSASAVANGPVECYTLSSIDFKEILEAKLISYLKTKMMLEDDEITISDLEVVKDLGVGSFGAVSLVRAKKNKSLYAIKAMNKTQIDVEKLHTNIDLEKGIMLRIDHPFLTKLVKTLKYDNYIFFLMEYNKGKELWDVIRDIGILNKIQTQFYAGSIMLGVDYLHSRKFVHRDIKPENIMILDTVSICFTHTI